MKDNDLSVVRNKEIGFIFQGFNLIANLTALENVELPLIYRGIDRKTRRKLAVESLKKVGLVEAMELIDYKVRLLDESQGTDAITRVTITATDGVDTWGTVGVSENVIEASWNALVDSLEYGLFRARVRAGK